MAESSLRETGEAADRWQGRRFRHGENLPGGMWLSIVTEIERRGEEWIVIRLDRRTEPLGPGETGLLEITSR